MVCPEEMTADGVLVGVTLLALFQSFSFCIYHIGSSQIQRSLNQIFYTAVFNFVIGSLLWFTVGYSMVFGKSQKGFIGSMNHAFLLDLQQSSSNETDCATKSHPDIVLVLFEMTFSILAPLMALITWIEYVKPTGAVLFITLWPIFVYYPVAHWIRGGGWLGTTINVLDFAGGLTLHATTGSTHFLITILMKKTFPACEKLSIAEQYSLKREEGFRVVVLSIGSVFTVAGWYCLNTGSLKNVDTFYSLVLLNTHFAACGSVISWVMVSFITGQWFLSDIINGLMVGLAGACSFSGYVQTWSALLIGSITGLLSHGFLTIIKSRCSICVRENSVDVTFLFGVPGILGSIAAGLFSTTSINSSAENGALFSRGIQLSYQLLGILVAISWPLVWTSLLLKFVHSTVGLFASKEASYESNLEVTHFRLADLPKNVNTEASLKERLMKAAKNGDVKEIQELRENFGINLGLKCFNQKTALHYACEGGHTKCVEFLLGQREVNIHAKDRYGATALSEAMRKHRDNLVPLLLDHGAKWTLDGVGEILCAYVAEGKIDEVRRLKLLNVDLNAKDCYGRTALHIAASKGDKLMVECLVDMKAQLNKVDSFGNRPLNCAEMHEHEEISEILVRHGALRIFQSYSQREICEEASKGNLRMLRHMVHNGASVSYCDANGRTPLHTSSEAGHLDVVKFLLTQPGININAKDKKNNTPLTDAILNMHNEVAEYLHLHGGEVEERRMMHLICKATERCDKRLVKQLLQWFNGSTVVDYNGESVYHGCVKVGDDEMLRILVRAGINFREINFTGITPLELAIQLQCNNSIIRILSDLEEGKLTKRSPETSVKSEKRFPNSKSKIRRRRTRRQTRVEVVTDGFSGEEKSPVVINDHALEDVSSHMMQPKAPIRTPRLQRSHGDGKEDFKTDIIDGTKRSERNMEENDEVTLADIELMNRKKYLHEPRYSEVIGEPHFV